MAMIKNKNLITAVVFFFVLAISSAFANEQRVKWRNSTDQLGYIYNSEAEAVSAARNYHSKYSDKTIRKININSGSSSIQIDYKGSTHEKELTGWHYSISGATDEQTVINRIKELKPSSPECSPTIVTPTGWIPSPYGNAYFNGIAGPSNVTRIEAQFYDYSKHMYSNATGECYTSNNQFMVLRNRSYQCPNIGILPEGAYWKTEYGWQEACTSYPLFSVYGKPLVDRGECGKEGNPCDVRNGDKIESVTDYDDSWLTFKRTYHSMVQAPNSSIGNGWSHNYSLKVFMSPSNNLSSYGLVDGNGYLEPMTLYTTGAYRSATDVNDKSHLKRLASEWELTKSNRRDYFDLTGKLIRRNFFNGPTLYFTYGSNDQLSSITDESGRTLSLIYNSDNNIQSVIQPDSQAINYVYDGNGNLTHVNYPDNTAIQYHYEDSNFPNHLTGITDKRGNRSYYSYDSITGQAISSVPVGNIGAKTFEYELAKTIVTNSVGNKREYTFDSSYNHAIKKIIDICDDCDDSIISYWNSYYGLMRITKNGQQTRFYNHYLDPYIRPSYKVEAYGTPKARRVDYVYDPRYSGNKTTETREHSIISAATGNACVQDVNCKKTNSVYDDSGNLTSLSVSGYKPDGSTVSQTTQWTYAGPYGQLTSIDGPRLDTADITTLEYYPVDYSSINNRGRLKKITLANGTVQRNNLQYSITGKIISEENPNGETLSYSYYPGNDRLMSITRTQAGLGITSYYTYIETGEVASVTTAYGTSEASTISFSYDAAKQLIRVTDNLSNYQEYSYDSEGNKTQENIFDPNDTLKKSLSLTYDRFNRVSLNAPNYSANNLTYNPNGTIKTQSNSDNIETAYSYDALNRLTTSLQDVGTLNIQTQYVYDVADRLIKVVDSENIETEYQYDDLGNLLSTISQDTGTTTYTYDQAGNRISQTDARGITVNYSYDGLNRLTSINNPNDGDITYLYDENNNAQNGIGRLTTVIDQAGTTKYTYDRHGNIKTQTQIQDGISFTTSYTYNLRNEIVNIIYPSGRNVEYIKNSLGQTIELNSSFNGIAQNIASSVSYLPFGPSTNLTFGNNISQIQTYDEDYRLTGITDGALLNYSFTFDQKNNITARDSNEFGNEAYQYDNVDRLTQSNISNSIENFTYDGVANRLSYTKNGNVENYFYSTNNHHLEQITSSAAQVFTYDSNGNTLNSNGYLFTYEDNNRLSEVKDSNQALLATYTYNDIGLRSKKVTDTATYYQYNIDGQLISESDNQGNILREYYYVNGTVIAMSNANDFYFIHSDQLGTPKLLTDNNQNIVWVAEHRSFGKALVDEDPDNNNANVEMNIRFPGQYYDQETGLHYNWNRYYNPTTGRYVTPDPIGILRDYSNPSCRSQLKWVLYMRQNLLARS